MVDTHPRRASSLHGATEFKNKHFSLHGGTAVARKYKTVHGGQLFAHLLKEKPCLLMSSMMDDDVTKLTFEIIFDSGDLPSLFALLLVSKRISTLAHDSLAQLSIGALIRALTRGQLPLASVATVERLAAHAALRGELLSRELGELMWYANLYLDGQLSRAQSWTLTLEPVSEDAVDEQAFPLLGFDTTPLSQSTCRTLQGGTLGGTGLVTEWFASHLPSQPLSKVHLPCVLAGPSKRTALAGSSAAKRVERRVPLELCRIVRQPAPEDVVQRVCGL